jgi:hypothetical protein
MYIFHAVNAYIEIKNHIKFQFKIIKSACPKVKLQIFFVITNNILAFIKFEKYHYVDSYSISKYILGLFIILYINNI